jgi:hypothetical protein
VLTTRNVQCGRMSAFVMCYPNGGEEQLSNCPNPDADCDMMKASIDWANFVDLETSHAYVWSCHILLCSVHVRCATG